MADMDERACFTAIFSAFHALVSWLFAVVRIWRAAVAYGPPGIHYPRLAAKLPSRGTPVDSGALCSLRQKVASAPGHVVAPGPGRGLPCAH